MVGWHHQLSGHEFEHALRDSEGQGAWKPRQARAEITEKLTDGRLPISVLGFSRKNFLYGDLGDMDKKNPSLTIFEKWKCSNHRITGVKKQLIKTVIQE